MSIAVNAVAEKPVNKWMITFGYYLSFLILGCTQAIIGITLTGLQNQTGVGIDMISLIFPLRSIGYMAGALLGGRLFDHLRGNYVFSGALLLLLLGVACLPFTSLFYFLCALCLVIGMAEGVIDVGGNTLLVWLHGSKVGPYLNGLHLSWGIGGLVIPQVVALSVSNSGGFIPAYMSIVVVALILMIALLRMANPRSPVTHSEEHVNQMDWILVGLIVAFFCFHVGAEGSMSNWITTYTLKFFSTENQPQVAYNMASVFWFAFTMGRVLAIPFASRLKPSTLLTIDMVGCLVGTSILMIFPGNLTITWVGVGIFALFVASLFPMTIAFAEREMVISAKLTSIFFLGSTSGAMLFPWVVGQYFERSSPQAMVVVVFGCTVAALGVYCILRLHTRKKKKLNAGL
jgi:MFS transporter, FHS family, Na+ dependent glucose transporter 1